MTLHIVSFDIPYPADYGGVIDVFYKIKALHALGVEITLHCFEYGERKQQLELEKYCESVYYYKRSRSIFHQLSFKPFIVSTRKNKQFLENLCLNNSPILFEGLHTCGFINHNALRNRKKFVRMHNIEWQYYENLATSETNIFKKLFFTVESLRLKRFEKEILPVVQKVFFIAPSDAQYFNDNYSFDIKKLEVIYPFHNHALKFSNFINPSNYLFFHGNLSVAENEKTVKDFIENLVLNKFPLKYLLIIAGKSPTAVLKNFIRDSTQKHFLQKNGNSHTDLTVFNNYLSIKNDLSHSVKLIDNPNDDYLSALSQQALAHILYVEKPAGVKLKFIRSLAENKNVFVHNNFLPDASWTDYCTVFFSWEDLRHKINNFDFSRDNIEMYEKRKALFETVLNNELNARKIISTIFS